MKYKILLLLFAIIIIVSSILSFVPIDQACKANTNSCKIVHASSYDSLLGINNNYLGLFAFLGMFILTLSHIMNPKKIKKQLITTGLILGSAFAIYFLYIQFIILNATCSYCLIADFTTIISLIVFFTVKGKTK